MNNLKHKVILVLLVFITFTLSNLNTIIVYGGKQKTDNLQKLIKNMTLDQKIGQLIVVGLDGYQSNLETREMIQKYNVSGFLLFQSNIKNQYQTTQLINSLKKDNSGNPLPLFFGADQEGGKVNRMPKEYSLMPSNKYFGLKNNQKLSYDAGVILGKQVKSLGLNIDFAPVLDINSNPKNPVIGDRSFGPDANIVSKLGIETMKGIQTQKIIPVIKHFPGHGDTSVDSHIGLPVVNNTLDRLKKVELVPFSKAVKNGADMFMIAHILLPKLDPNNPASMSKPIITGLLRNYIGFDGVVITDDMLMGAITKNYKLADAAIKSLNAGADIVLVCHDYRSELAVINGIKNAVKNKIISLKSIDDKVYRIAKLKKKYGLSNLPATPENVNIINKEINNLLRQ